MSSWFNWFKIKNTDEIDNVEEIIEEKEDVFVEEKKEKKKVVFVEDKLVEEKEDEFIEEWHKGATFPSLEFTSYPTKTNTTEDIEQISIEMKDEDDIENISKNEIKNITEELIENVIGEGKENASEIINDIYESLDKIVIEGEDTLDSDDDTLDSDDDTIDNNINNSVTTVRCDCCQELIFYNKSKSMSPTRCSACELKYMN